MRKIFNFRFSYFFWRYCLLLLLGHNILTTYLLINSTMSRRNAISPTCCSAHFRIRCMQICVWRHDRYTNCHSFSLSTSSARSCAYADNRPQTNERDELSHIFWVSRCTQCHRANFLPALFTSPYCRWLSRSIPWLWLSFDRYKYK